MDENSLLERRSKAENEFNELEKQKQQIDNRQSELRGQYQLINEQIEALKPAEEPKVSPKADVIDVTKVKGA